MRLALEGNDRRGLYADVAAAVSATGTDIRSMELQDDRWQGARARSLVEVENLAHLQKIMKAARRVKGITEVARREEREAHDRAVAGFHSSSVMVAGHWSLDESRVLYHAESRVMRQDGSSRVENDLGSHAMGSQHWACRLRYEYLDWQRLLPIEITADVAVEMHGTSACEVRRR